MKMFSIWFRSNCSLGKRWQTESCWMDLK